MKKDKHPYSQDKSTDLNASSDFTDLIIKTFEKFQIQHRLTNECISINKDDKGNIKSLSIKLPTLPLFEEFNQHLGVGNKLGNYRWLFFIIPKGN